MRSHLFPSPEAAWFWTSAALAARQAGRPAPPADCTPEDVLRCLDDIYRRRRIVLLHARVLRHYGQKGRAPVPNRPRERCDLVLWREAMQALGDRLRQRGLVAPESLWGAASLLADTGAR